VRLYLDSSALVKLVQREAESEGLRRYLRHHRSDRLVTCSLARVEVARAVLGGDPRALEHARRQLSRLDQVLVTASLLDRAATLAPDVPLGSLDAIHLAAALVVGEELRAVVTYDQRLAGAAGDLGIEVETPG
jgi:predicted nucleic acid-binding protein